MKLLLAFSLFGTDKKYRAGFAENVRLARIIYPEFRVVVYCDEPSPEALLADEVNVMGPANIRCMTWRIFAAAEPADVILFRDADSRLNCRERAAVDEWRDSGLNCHSAHDHRHHRIHCLMGGMMGLRGGLFPHIEHLWKAWCARQGEPAWIDDLNFLAECIYPHVADSCLHHSSLPIQWPYRPFPLHGEVEGFMGQQFEADGTPVWPK